MIKTVIDQEIKNVSSKEYKTLSETNKDNKILSSQKKRHKKPDTTNEQILPMKRLKVTTRFQDSPQLAPSTPNTWYYNPVDVDWQQDRADSLGLSIHNDFYVTFKEPRDVSSHAQPNHTHRTLGDGNCFFFCNFNVSYMNTLST